MATHALNRQPILLADPSVPDRYGLLDEYTSGHAAVLTVLDQFGSRLATHALNRQVLLIAPDRRISDAMVGSSKRSPRADVSQIETNSTAALIGFRKRFPRIDLRVRAAADRSDHWYRSTLSALAQAKTGTRIRFPVVAPADLMWDAAALARIDLATR